MKTGGQNPVTGATLYSYHVFIFPFQWESVNYNSENITVEEKNNIERFQQLLDASDVKGKWSSVPFKPDTILKYNEFQYFYDFVRDTLYYTRQPGTEEDGKCQVRNLFLRHYQYKAEPGEWDYVIGLTDNPGEKAKQTYRLSIESITLQIYNTGVGMLAFHLANRIERQKDPDSILKINQFGRRIFPPFYGMDPQLIGTEEQYGYKDFSSGLSAVKASEIPDSITIQRNTDGNILAKEDYTTAYEDFRRTSQRFYIPNHICTFFGNMLTGGRDKAHLKVKPVLDDRMFVLCWYGNNEIVDEVRDKKTYKAKVENGEFVYLDNEWLYKFVFVDKSLTCQNDHMRKELMRKHVLSRWVNYGTLYGVTRYSFVALTQSLEDEGFRNNAGFVVNHMQTMYYKMAELCLLQRASILRFSDEVSEISILKIKNDGAAMEAADLMQFEKRVSSLYKGYIRFVNRIYFREVTAQEQGIELYDKMQEVMRIGEQIKDLDSEIQELYNYLIMEEQKEQSREAQQLSKVATWLLPPTFVAGLFGMNNYQNFFPESAFFPPLLWWVILLIIIVMSFIIGYKLLSGKSIK